MRAARYRGFESLPLRQLQRQSRHGSPPCLFAFQGARFHENTRGGLRRSRRMETPLRGDGQRPVQALNIQASLERPACARHALNLLKICVTEGLSSEATEQSAVAVEGLVLHTCTVLRQREWVGRGRRPQWKRMAKR